MEAEEIGISLRACDVPQLEWALANVDPGEEGLASAIRVLIRVAKAAARVNELVGTETEDGQAEAWEELDAALGDVQFAEVSA